MLLDSQQMQIVNVDIQTVCVYNQCVRVCKKKLSDNVTKLLVYVT